MKDSSTQPGVFPGFPSFLFRAKQTRDMMEDLSKGVRCGAAANLINTR